MKKYFYVLLISGFCMGRAWAQVKNDTKKPITDTKKPATDTKKPMPLTACNPSEQLSRCIQGLAATGFKYLKGYKLEGKGGAIIEQEYTFGKGVTYYISLTNNDPSNPLRVSLIDDSGRVIVMSYNEEIKRNYPGVEIRVQRSGVYKISFTNATPKSPICGAAILGFKR